MSATAAVGVGEAVTGGVVVAVATAGAVVAAAVGVAAEVGALWLGSAPQDVINPAKTNQTIAQRRAATDPMTLVRAGTRAG